MSGFRVQPAAGRRLDEIFVYTRETWGDAQAERYIRGLFERFLDIAARRAVWRPVPADFGVAGFYGRYERHIIHWRELPDGDVGIVTILHGRMHQMDRFRHDSED